MKLLFCNTCKDIFNLTFEIKRCSCGKAAGQYKDNINAVVTKDSVAIGLNNQNFPQAVIDREESAWGVEFSAFVIPKIVSSIEYVDALEPTPVAGWAHPLLAKKWHYFKADDITSVCGTWMLMGGRDDSPEYDDQPENCAACKKKVAKLRKA